MHEYNDAVKDMFVYDQVTSVETLLPPTNEDKNKKTAYKTEDEDEEDYETPRSLSPIDDILNSSSQSDDNTSQDSRAFYRGRMADQVERDGLSINIPLKSRGRTNDIAQARYWREERTDIDGFQTYLYSIDDLEYSVDDLGQGKVILSCIEGPPKKAELRVTTHIKWL